MKIAIIALTYQGSVLAAKLGSELKADIYLKKEFMEDYSDFRHLNRACDFDGKFSEVAGKLFTSYEAIVFIMACGIVVRSIAPYIKDKKTDPAVIVLDEMGKHAISLLSGHIGGANELAGTVAEITGGVPVITTATDINQKVSFDVFALKNQCTIENFDAVKYISSELVNGGKVLLYSDVEIKGNRSENLIPYNPGSTLSYRTGVILSSRTDVKLDCEKTLILRPGNLVLGIGCRRGTSFEQIKTAIEDFMEKNKRSLLSLQSIATIDVKQDEEGILDFCRKYKIELHIVPREKIGEAPGVFSASQFVQEKVGVPAVAEPCALIASGNGRMLCKKTIYKGITLALAEEEKIYTI